MQRLFVQCIFLLPFVAMIILVCLWGQGIIGNNHVLNGAKTKSPDSYDLKPGMTSEQQEQIKARLATNLGLIDVTGSKMTFKEQVKSMIDSYNEEITRNQRVTQIENSEYIQTYGPIADS